MVIEISWMIWLVLAWLLGFGDILSDFGSLFGG